MAGVPPQSSEAPNDGGSEELPSETATAQPQIPVEVDMAGAPQTTNNNHAFGGGAPFLPPMPIDCEVILRPQQCYAAPMCSWILDDSQWVCIETKEIESGKHFWAVTNAHQGRVPGPIPGASSFGSGSRWPSWNANQPNAGDGPSSPESEGGVAYSPGFKQKLQQLRQQRASSEDASSVDRKLTMYIFVGAGGFFLGISAYFAFHKFGCGRQTSHKNMLTEDFVRSGDRQI